MSRIDNLIAELCPDGVEYRKLDDIGRYVKAKKSVEGMNADTYTGVDNLVKDKGGRVPAESIPSSGMCTEVAAGDLLLGNIRPNLRKLWLADVDGGASNDVLVYRLDADDIAPEFLYQAMADERFFEYDIRYMRGAKMPRGDKARILAYEIPVPPLDVQREVVRVLDSFAGLEAGLEAELEAELEARKAQYAHYRDELLSRESLEAMAGCEVPALPLGELAVIGTGSHDTKDGLADGKYAFYARGIEPLKLNEWDFDETAIVTAGDGAGVGKVFHYVEGKYALHQRAYRIVPHASMLNSRYFFHVMRAFFYEYIMRNAVQGSVASIRRRMLDQFPVFLPPLSVQQQVVDILDRFDALTTSLTDGLSAEIEARQQQYEHYRDRLLGFPRKEAAS